MQKSKHIKNLYSAKAIFLLIWSECSSALRTPPNIIGDFEKMPNLVQLKIKKILDLLT